MLHDHHRTALRRPRKICQGADALSDRLLGWLERRPARVRTLRAQAERVEAERAALAERGEADFDREVAGLRAAVRGGGLRQDAMLFRALAASCEAARREKGLTPHDVQIMGALAMARGWLAEMATGEGKTLTVSLWGVVAGWGGFPCHVVTSNDYLAARDAEEMGPVYLRCGLRAAAVTGALDAARRQSAYRAEVVYTTSKELLADFLKDRLVLGRLAHADLRLVRRLADPGAIPEGQLLQRGLHTAIIDEADNVLVDEAVIPLRISQKYRNDLLRQAYALGSVLAARCERGTHHTTDPERKSVRLTPEGHALLDAVRADLPPLWRGRRRGAELLEQCLVAREFFHREKDYIVREGKVVIVDAFSGRLMPDRSWSQGLHQAIEAKEEVEMSDPTETLASLSFQKFFRLFRRLSGLSGTALEAAPEFWSIYRLPVLAIPTHKPRLRVEAPDSMHPDLESKRRAVLDAIRDCHHQGRPLLVGTSHVAESEHLAEALAREGFACQVLNAVRSEEEAAIIARAGQAGMITIATNMAGRGTDIKLGEGVAALGGLHVLATERHESRRIDRQLFGRAGRHGDPGYARAFTSLEDELVRRHGFAPVTRAVRRLFRAWPQGGACLAKLYLRLAQKRAEASAYFLRQQVMKSDTQTEEALSFSGAGLGG